jgi:hypothetical protein
MKTILKPLVLIAAMLSAFNVIAKDNNLVIFSQDGNKFSVILNGLRQNESPSTNVKVSGLDAPNYKVKIIFENQAVAPFDQTVYLMDGGVEVDNKEFSYSLEMKKNGEWKLKPNSIADVSTAPPPSDQVVYVYNTSGPATPKTTTTTVSTTTTSGQPGVITIGTTGQTTQQTTTTTSGTTGTTTQQTTTTTTGSPNATGVVMGVGGVGMNVVIYDNMGGTTQQTTTTTTTQTSGMDQPAPKENNGTDCYWPMTSTEFANAKSSVEKQSFEDQKLKVAKQILSTNCMSSAQVKEIMAMFSYEETKLEWAKFAYGKTTDPNNYYQLNDGFTYSSSVDELNLYIEAHKK